jgi:pilus assembly protein CpaE
VTALPYGDAASAARSRTPVVIIGSAEGVTDLLGALGHHSDVEILDASTFLADSTAVLEGGGVEAVLYVTHAGPGWLDDLAAIREHTSAPIVVLSSNQSGAVLDQAFAAGAAEALLLPQGVENVAYALRRAHRMRGRQPGVAEQVEGNVTTVFSPKGGIGKTVIATNLAAVFAGEEKRRTLLVDLDLQFGDTAIVLGLEPKQTLHDLIAAPGGLDPDKLAGYATRHESGVEVLPAPPRPQDADLVSDAKLARLFEVACSSYDEIVVDCAPFLHGPILTALDYTNALVMICSAEVPALKDVGLSLSTLRLLAFPEDKIKLVMNNAYGGDGLSRKDIEGALGLSVSAMVPNNRVVSRGVNRGVPATQLDAGSDFAKGIRDLSSTLHSSRPSAADESQPKGRRVGRRRAKSSSTR